MSFVTDIDTHISSAPSRFSKLMPPSRSANSIFSSATNTSGTSASRKRSLSLGGSCDDPANSPVKLELSKIRAQPSLLEQMPEEEWEGDGDEPHLRGLGARSVLGDKENIPVNV